MNGFHATCKFYLLGNRHPYNPKPNDQTYWLSISCKAWSQNRSSEKKCWSQSSSKKFNNELLDKQRDADRDNCSLHCCNFLLRVFNFQELYKDCLFFSSRRIKLSAASNGLSFGRKGALRETPKPLASRWIPPSMWTIWNVQCFFQ